MIVHHELECAGEGCLICSSLFPTLRRVNLHRLSKDVGLRECWVTERSILERVTIATVTVATRNINQHVLSYSTSTESCIFLLRESSTSSILRSYKRHLARGKHVEHVRPHTYLNRILEPFVDEEVERINMMANEILQSLHKRALC